MTDRPADGSVFVRELIRRVHQDLVESREERRASGSPAIFEVERLTVEVNFVAVAAKDARGGLDFKVITIGGLNVGGGKHYENQEVHKVTLELAALPYQADSRFTDLEKGSRFMPREEPQEE